MIGYHVTKKDRTMHDAIKEDVEMLKEYGFKQVCVQIFVTGPRSYTPILSTPEEKQAIKELNVPIYIHGAYVDQIWSRSPQSIHNVKQEMRICHEIGGKGVIVHLDNRVAEIENLAYAIKNLNFIDANVKETVTLFLEIHVSKQSRNTFETPAKISALFKRIRKILNLLPDKPHLKFGVCVDSAHLWSCGYSMTMYEETKLWVDKLVKLLTPGTPIIFHLNDSAVEFDRGVDRHAALTFGNIWGMYNQYSPNPAPFKESGLNYLLSWSLENNIPMILERNGPNVRSDLSLIAKMAHL